MLLTLRKDYTTSCGLVLHCITVEIDGNQWSYDWTSVDVVQCHLPEYCVHTRLSVQPSHMLLPIYIANYQSMCARSTHDMQ